VSEVELTVTTHIRRVLQMSWSVHIRNMHETFWAETETRRLKSEKKPRRDVTVNETLAETLKLPRLSRVSGSSTSHRDVFRDVYGETYWQWKKLYGL